MTMRVSRRRFITKTAGAAVTFALGANGAESRHSVASFAGEVGITTGSFMQHLRRDPELHKTLLLDLPRRMRDDLGLKIIDLMSETLPSNTSAYLDELKGRAGQNGCVLTNLKLNQEGLDVGASEPALREKSFGVYRKSIDAAHRLGCRWVRPALRGRRPELKQLANGLRELVNYSRPKGITVLIENQSWMREDPDAIPAILDAVGSGIAAQPDIAGFSGDKREEALRQAFRRAATCDFKVFDLGPNGEHREYNLRQSFQIGWDSGFRGPWCM